MKIKYKYRFHTRDLMYYMTILLSYIVAYIILVHAELFTHIGFARG